MTTRRWLMLGVATAAALLIVGRALAGVYSDYLWYDSLGAKELWKTRLLAIAGLGVGSAGRSFETVALRSNRCVRMRT